MTIYQPEDKTLTKERIEAILILMNHVYHKNRGLEGIATFVEEFNTVPNLKGYFAISEKGEIVFVAQ